MSAWARAWLNACPTWDIRPSVALLDLHDAWCLEQASYRDVQGAARVYAREEAVPGYRVVVQSLLSHGSYWRIPGSDAGALADQLWLQLPWRRELTHEDLVLLDLAVYHGVRVERNKQVEVARIPLDAPPGVLGLLRRAPAWLETLGGWYYFAAVGEEMEKRLEKVVGTSEREWIQFGRVVEEG